VSTDSFAVRRRSTAETLAGLMASGAIFASLVALAYRPFRIAPFAIAIALIAAAIGGRHQRLIYAAVIIASLCWFFGMIVAIVTNNPVY
jgi:hypothetical protein